MIVPFLDLQAQYISIREELELKVLQTMRSCQYILGPEVQKFEENIAKRFKADYVLGVSSGTDALLLALMALGISYGNEVITTPFTFFATAGVIARLGATPVFVDIDPKTFNLDPYLVQEAVTSKTRAVIPVHLYGRPAALPMITYKGNYIPVVEDAAQAIGAMFSYENFVGTTSRIGCFSCFPSKNLGSAGDAGFVITHHKSLYDKMFKLRVHGSHPKYYHAMVGGNFRLDSLQAAILNVKLPHIEHWNAKRLENAKAYDNLFHAHTLTGKVVAPSFPEHDLHVFNQYTIRVLNGKRDALQAYLAKKQIGTQVYYPVGLHLQECFSHLGYQSGDLPHAELACKEVLSLPIYPELSVEQISYVVKSIGEFYET